MARDPRLRRAASRFGTQLSAAIYDKALRITDQSGAVAKESDAEQKDDDEKTGGADVGKIVNLMGIDWWGSVDFATRTAR